MKHHRIWELDALRGLCILGMVAVHLLFDLTGLYGTVSFSYPGWLLFLMDWGGVAFFLISGICATLGSRCVKRGLLVAGCGLLISLVTFVMYRMGMADRAILIYFGVLHCLGVCMILWAIFRKLSNWGLALVGAVLVALGLWVRTITVETRWLVWLGLLYPGFATSDYFPLLPFLGFFLLGGLLGRLLYGKKESLLPQVNAQNPLLRGLQWIGRHSLPIYLLHQPILTGILFLIYYL